MTWEDWTLLASVVGAAASGAAWVRQSLVKARDARAELIATGEAMGIEYIPGEDLDGYRRRVVDRRDDRSWAAEQRRKAAGGDRG